MNYIDIALNPSHPPSVNHLFPSFFSRFMIFALKSAYVYDVAPLQGSHNFFCPPNAALAKVRTKPQNLAILRFL